MPRVSVVVPAYNNGRHIAATLDSILNQTLHDFELVIADHSSTDDTQDVISGYESDPRVRTLTSTSGGGAEANWNRATRAALAPLIKLVCADDLLDPAGLAEQVAALESNPTAVMAASPRRVVRDDGGVLVRSRGVEGLAGVIPGLAVVKRMVRSGTNLLGEPVCVTIRTSALCRAGLWDGTYPYAIDQLTYMRVLSQGNLVVVPHPLASFRVSAGQWSAQLANTQYADVRAVHEWARAAYPDDVTGSDVRLGNARAYRNAMARRLLYRMMPMLGSPRST